MAAGAANAQEATSAKPSTVEPVEIGWMFVPQYYTFVNKDPGRLHCFYTKRSTLIHSVEGEEAKPYHGQQARETRLGISPTQEIHERIMELGFEDCKVYVSNVDSQSSADGGIIVQVIGEMSNRGGPWRKFAQTFFLAEQPNGYYVLNDIFRFIKEDAEDRDENTGTLSAPQESPALNPSTIAAQQQHEAPAHSQAPSALAPSFDYPNPALLHEQPAAQDEPTPVQTGRPQINGFHDHNHGTQAPISPPVPQREPSPVVATAPAPAEETTQPIEVPSTVADVPADAPTEDEPAPVSEQPEASTSTAPEQPAASAAASTSSAPAPAEPPVKKSWASLAAANAGGSKWGSAVVDRGGVSSSGPPAPRAEPAQQSAPAPSTSTTPASFQRQPFNPASINTGLCFVKGVTDSVAADLASLREHLQMRFGAIRELDLIRGKGCAFLEFASPDSARRAIQVSQPVREGGEGGIPLPTGPTVHVEIRRSKEEVAAYQSARGIVPNRGGDGRGGARGGPANRGGARGAAPPRQSQAPAGQGRQTTGSASNASSTAGQPRTSRA